MCGGQSKPLYTHLMEPDWMVDRHGTKRERNGGLVPYSLRCNFRNVLRKILYSSLKPHVESSMNRCIHTWWNLSEWFTDAALNGKGMENWCCIPFYIIMDLQAQTPTHCLPSLPLQGEWLVCLEYTFVVFYAVFLLAYIDWLLYSWYFVEYRIVQKMWMLFISKISHVIYLTRTRKLLSHLVTLLIVSYSGYFCGISYCSEIVDI